MEPQPPRRTTHAAGVPKRLLVYDRWGRFGRPVLLLHGVLFDRTMWWPVAAELSTATSCTVIAPDLPGHGDSPARASHDPETLATDLAGLVHRLDLHRAPVVVGHAESATVAHAFARRFAVHQVLTVDDLGDGQAEIPEHYRPYAQAREDPALLTAYEKWPRRARTWPHLADPVGFAAGLKARLT
jgi:pimeloyl-ACP methyl ester carboxylesterase